MSIKSKLLASLLFVAAMNVAHAQKKWDDLTDEEKVTKLKSFRAENQKYLKNTLGMTPTQMDDIDNVNICFLSTLDRIDRYAKDASKKDEAADAVASARWVQLDAIMGAEKHKKYEEHLKAKIEDARKK